MRKRLVIYPEFDARIERDYMYSVSVTQGDETANLPVYNHTEDSRVDRNPIDDKRVDEFRRFSSFAFEGEGVRVDIRVNRDFYDYSVMPSAKKFRHEFKNGVISVFLEEPDYFLIRVDGKDHTILSVFADAPETEISTDGENVFVVDSWQEVDGGVWDLTRPNTTIYIPAGSVLNARVRILADNCKIIGRGAIVDPCGDIYRYDVSKINTTAVIFVKDANNTIIDGIHMLDSKAYNIQIVGVWQERWATGSCVKNTKILSTQMSSDGVACCYYSRDSYVEHCFIYCADNALVYEDYAHYKDITIGTTCNAIFPQTDVLDSFVEDIYIFRADEGIINPAMGGENGITKIEKLVIKNLDAVDVTFAPYFLFVEFPKSNPVVSQEEGITLENIWLPRLSDIGMDVFYLSSASGYCPITLKNLSIDGILIHEFTPEAVGADIRNGANNIRYIVDDDFEPCILPNRRIVNYQNEINVFVGKHPVYFKYPIIKDGSCILLPKEQLQAELRTDYSATSELRAEKSYVPLCDLVESNMAKMINVEGNSIVITPNDNPVNLLLPDSGIVSKYTEYICYASHLIVINEDGENIYRIINTYNHKHVGIFRVICEEIHKYGKGTYRLLFDARSGKKGRIKSSAIYSTCDSTEKFFDIDSKWVKCSMDIDIELQQLNSYKIAMLISCDGENAMDVFDVKNIELFKIK